MESLLSRVQSFRPCLFCPEAALSFRDTLEGVRSRTVHAQYYTVRSGVKKLSQSWATSQHRYNGKTFSKNYCNFPPLKRNYLLKNSNSKMFPLDFRYKTKIVFFPVEFKLTLETTFFCSLTSDPSPGRGARCVHDALSFFQGHLLHLSSGAGRKTD